MADKTKENEVALEQFRKNLDHILIDGKKVGPEITIGDTVLKFKAKAPVKALAALIGADNRVQGMETYIRKTLVPGQEEAFDALLEDIDIEGLAEILNALGEGYTSFPEKS
jgi:hypothetical protein